MRHLSNRLVVSWHHGSPVPARPWNRLLLGPRGTDGLVLLSPRLAEQATLSLGWPGERLAVVPGCVDVERFTPREPSGSHRRELGLRPDDRLVGVVGRLQPHRRFDLLLEAFSQVRDRAPSLRLVVLGRGTRAHQVLHGPVARLGLGSAVISQYRRDDYIEVLSLLEALVFLVPGSDGSCRALLEAMSMGIPGIVSHRGVLPETVCHERHGLVVSESSQELASAFYDLWLDPARWQAFGRAARESVLENHSIEKAAGELERFYSGVTGMTRRLRAWPF
jgi:glycosyltransferase involved in cell wall biosynthesis